MNIKQILVNRLLEMVGEKIESAQKSIHSAKEARDNETKSSVGDKYETGRAMMQFEIEKNNIQLSKARKLENELSKIDFTKDFNKAEFGSIVFTNYGNYFISIGIGKVEVEKDVFFCVSPASPIGKVLLGKSVGDKIVFQGKEIVFAEIL